jgi:phosphatidylglycerophosphate synthase
MKNLRHEIIKANDKEKIALSKNAWYSNHVARPISLWVTKPFIRLEPTFVCFIMILIGLAALPFFAIGGYLYIIIGALILQIHYIFDHIDGNVARLMNKKSKRGKYLDFVPNILVNPLVFAFLGYGHYMTFGNVYYLLLGFSASFFFVAREPARLFRYLMKEELNLNSDKIRETISNKKDNSKLIQINRFLNVIFDFPGIMNIILLFALTNSTQYLIVFYGLTLPFLFLIRTFYEFKYWKNIDNNG